MPDEKIDRYGMLFEPDTPDIKIEMALIQRGGQGINKFGKPWGEGLFYHYRKLQNILWPDEDDHRWSDLILTEILRNTVTVCMGAANSTKTHSMAKFGLVDYWCFPNETLIIVSSTTLQSLEFRVWGDIKGLFNSAKERFPELPGIVLDNKHAICTDDLSEDKINARDMRKGIVCFKSGTLVDTFYGQVPIEKVKVGDLVYNAIGVGEVIETMKSKASELVTVNLKNGKSFTCTPEHPVFTQKGWIKACNLLPTHYIMSVYETMSLMRNPNKKQKVLFKSLCGELDANARSAYRILHSSKRGQNCGIKSKVASGQSRAFKICPSQIEKHIAGKGITATCESIKDDDKNGLEASIPRRKRNRANEGRENFNGNVSRGDLESRDLHRNEGGKRLSNKLQGGLGVSKNKSGNRSRRSVPQSIGESGVGREENGITRGSWVDSVKIHKPEDISGTGNGEEGTTVYNLAVSGHPSYSIYGVLVHNCLPCKTSTGGRTNIANYVGIKQKRRRYIADEMQFMEPAMLDSLANVNTGDFKMIVAGNPIGEDDSLDKIAEPKGGWGSEGEITKTTVWDNKLFLDSRTINLVGIDSPNFDYPQVPKPRYPYLTNQNSIDRVLAGVPAGKDSWQFWSQCMGVRRSGMGAKRVLTQIICEAGGAFDEPTWDGNRPTVKIAALDAAYGGTGGDRCVLIFADFGWDVDGKQIFVAQPPIIVPVSVRLLESPEDQIAKFVKNECETRGVSPRNFFYDSTGRGSLGLPLARHWSDQVQAVEFGGKPSKMPVSLDFYVYDPTIRTRRLQTCEEHYSKKVSEIWYSARYAVEAKQVRKLPREVADELYKRSWSVVAGNKVEVETKKDMKDRVGRSPDLADAWTLGLWGARQRGFQITKQAGVENSSASASDNLWLKKWKHEADKISRSHDLIECP